MGNTTASTGVGGTPMPSDKKDSGAPTVPQTPAPAPKAPAPAPTPAPKGSPAPAPSTPAPGSTPSTGTPATGTPAFQKTLKPDGVKKGPLGAEEDSDEEEKGGDEKSDETPSVPEGVRKDQFGNYDPDKNYPV